MLHLHLIRFFLTTATLLWLALGPAISHSAALESAEQSLPHLNLQLISAVTGYQKETNFTVAIKAVPEKGWHIYWKYPGDSGSAPKIDWSSSFGANITGPEFPFPKRIPVGHLVNFGYDDEILLTFRIEPNLAGESAIELRADTEFLVCKEECIPVNTILSLSVPRITGSTDGLAENTSSWSEEIEYFSKKLPFEYPSIELQAFSNSSEIILSGKFPDGKKPASLSFFPLTPLSVQNSAVQTLTVNDNKFQLSIAKHKDYRADTIEGILVSASGWTPDSSAEQAVNVRARLQPLPSNQIVGYSSDITVLVLTAALAFLAGLILNLMPCVFPVLTLKIIGLVEKTRLSEKELHIQSLFFSAGVITSFLTLGGLIAVARAGGESLGWGFQLQSQGFVASLSLLIFILGLNFLGVFEFGSTLQKISGRISNKGHTIGGAGKSFLDGVLMTTLATPCTAPFMGSALAYALSAPTLHLISVFVSLALGVAAPFVTLSYSARLRSLLPKPGLWMETLKKVLAFPLFATTIWLLWVLGSQAGINILITQLLLLLLVAFFLWLYGSFAGLECTIWQRRIFSLLALLSILFASAAGAFFNFAENSETDLIWETFTEARVKQFREQNRIVYVDFTAAWCITCQVNKFVAFSSEDVLSELKKNDVVTLKADWTNRDPAISEALKKFGREGVPLNVIYPKNSSRPPEILPQILTPAIVISALSRAAEHE